MIRGLNEAREPVFQAKPREGSVACVFTDPSLMEPTWSGREKAMRPKWGKGANSCSIWKALVKKKAFFTG